MATIATPEEVFQAEPNSRGLFVYIDVDKELWWEPAPRDSVSRLTAVARQADGLASVLVGGTGGMTTDKLRRGITSLLDAGVKQERIGIFTLDPGLAPIEAGFVSCPILLNRSRSVLPFDSFFKAFPRLRALSLPMLVYGYLLVAPADDSSVGRALGADVLSRDAPDEIAAFGALATSIGLRVLALETGSGAENPIDAITVARVRSAYPHFLIVGGGVRTAEQVSGLLRAGANAVNVGDILEKTESVTMLLAQLCDAAAEVRTGD